MKSSFKAENGIYCPTDAGVPWGPYTQQIGIWGYEEVLQAQYNTTINDQVWKRNNPPPFKTSCDPK